MSSSQEGAVRLETGVDVKDSRNVNWTWYTIFCAFSAALASFNYGYNIGVVNAPELVIRSCTGILDQDRHASLPGCVPMSTVAWSFVIATFALGGMFGGLGVSNIMNTIGRRKTLFYNNFLFLVGALLLTFSTTVVQFIIGRLIVGVASGVVTTVAPVYVGEIATIPCRGAFGTLVQLSIVIGVLVSQALGLVLSTAIGWRILFGLSVLPSILQVITLMFSVETPPFLSSQGRIDEAYQAMARLRAGYSSKQEMDDIIHSQRQLAGTLKQGDNFNADQPMTILQILRSPMLKLLVLVVVIHALQQLTGINSIIFYSTSMFTEAFGEDAARAVTAGIGVLNLIMTLVSIVLIDRTGRKTLLLGSIIGVMLTSGVVVMASVYNQNVVVAVAVFVFSACFSIGLGPVPWMLVTELFDTKAVGAASAAALGTNWLSNFLVGFLFPLIDAGISPYSFLIFVGFGVFGLIFVGTQLVETKGKSVEQIQSELLGSRSL
jgi:sugar porter (SP) family MFS transporter